MMMMEAIRLSLASEEDRRKRDEKEVRKEAKRREKEAKKADKVARKAGLYSNNTSTNASSAVLQVPGAGETSLGRVASSSSSTGEEPSTTTGKGKGVERGPTSASDEQDATVSSSDLLGTPEPSKQSHLRHVSSAASSVSSLMETTPDDRTPGHGTADGSNTSLEPMFNFRSLAAVIGDEEKGNESEHVEDASHYHGEGSSSANPSLHQPSSDTGNVEPIEPTTVPNPPVEDKEKEGSKDISPKELETRSVEITNTPTNTETTS
jgi:hypothetical protein